MTTDVERWTSRLVGRLSDFPPAKAHLVQVDGLEIGIYNIESKLYAVRNLCPHRGAPLCLGRFGGTMLPSERNTLVYGLNDRVIVCPWHRWEWDITTGLSPFDADKRRLIRYEVELEGDQVFLRIPTARDKAEAAEK
jgi:nitrite reductase/ring-hydroxylating ferredoxin subunit